MSAEEFARNRNRYLSEDVWEYLEDDLAREQDEIVGQALKQDLQNKLASATCRMKHAPHRKPADLERRTPLLVQASPLSTSSQSVK